ncbi:MAG: cobaltochelatase subunit CobN [Hyphomicrobiales bacterium]|nr:cobaltochelatase subunit CobN [Hyphomicrobiales bacterium]MBV8823792.1 cobaltochelatase subunit CobN [Hyphomicrobiales bacterium]MBV9428468.1 cobaltochelatase subunit CobN [Bradyrhizobiaceae bacterium]
MHLLTTTSTTLDEIIEAVDLRQPPGDIAVLSFAESDLAGLAAAWTMDKDALPSVRLTQLSDLRHPLSIDLWTDRVGRHAKVILVRLLGGLDFWRYGVERLTAVARERGIPLALLPGEDRDDPRLADLSTIPAAELNRLLAFFREGGTENLRALLRHLARYAGAELEIHQPRPVPRTAGYLPGIGPVDLDRLVASLAPDRPVVPIVFYRALLLAGDLAPIDAMCAALATLGLAPAPLVVPGLKDEAAAEFLRGALARLLPAVIITTTAFAAGNGAEPTPLDGPDVPVLQVVIANTKRDAWRDSPRGLGAADLAMHVVLPELDGRILAGAIAFKDPLPPHDGLAFTAFANTPVPSRVAMVADRVAELVRLQNTARAERRIAVLIPDYPGAPGRAGYAVGLDVPQSVVALLSDLRAAGYIIDDAPQTARALLDDVASTAAHPLAESEESSLSLEEYARLSAALPPGVLAGIEAAWGDPAADADAHDGAFRFRACAYGNIIVALAPDRGSASERRAEYHDPALPPRHALVAFGLWLRECAKVHAVVHMGAHGTLEWLPGKAVALSQTCYPETIVGPLPVIYPFIVSNPGEAAQAKRRIAAVTIGHAPPPLVASHLSGDARELERLVDEYAQADGLDRRRRERLARLIVEHAERSGLSREADVAPDLDPNQALRRIDAWLCDLKDLRVKDGQHVYGRAAPDADPLWQASAAAEQAAVLAALDGRRVAPGPAGSPERGRRDVLPTGRNLFTADPRALPTRTAFDLGRLAADEVIRRYLQSHGEMPRALVIDLWGSATLRTGGEEIAQGLALMGCRPVWNNATARVTGIEVEATAAIGRPRVDVTWRVSGLFRDMFPTQIALIDAAVRAVAARDESAEDNPLATAARGDSGAAPARIFGTAPGAYGAGIEHLLGREHDRSSLGTAYLAAGSHSYGAAADQGTAVPGAFAARVAAADLLLHPSDDPGRDLLEGVADVGFVGGFAAAAAALGNAPDLIMLDVTDPQRPRARPLSKALARIVRGRAVDVRFIAGQMRHGPRGAAELAETVDRLIDFAETTDAVPSTLIDLVHEAYLTDPAVRAFLLRENPAAARAIGERLASARRQGLWHPRRNDIDATLASFLIEATA